MMYELDDIDRRNRDAFERDWAAQHNLRVEDLAKLNYVAFPVFSDEANDRPAWEMMVRGPLFGEIIVKM